jgi:hypothetical protein
MPRSLIARVQMRASCAPSRNRYGAQGGSGSLPALPWWTASMVGRVAEQCERVARRWHSAQPCLAKGADSCTYLVAW